MRSKMARQTNDPGKSKNEFEDARKNKPLNLFQEFAYFLAGNKKWWMVPIIVILAAMGLVVMLASTGAAPFIYTLF